ncbi:AAA family ATPase [Fusobacterium polymorphum]|uniref:AAA family ATPase n=1 Tax=Fusobacterium nucleatum subsp. polymorphum TaxID=76857 RepID=UPI001EEEDD92|nr:AAA family ATPase [Fusobacterium nucleatum]MCG6841148.1 ATP-binding protein [Fusobacterium nucleatum]
MKRLAIGVDDFKEIIKEDFYYIDKTKFIEDILEDGSKVKLLNRPRRFGKTLNMTTLKYFFDIENAEENRKLFNNLYIEKSKYIEEQGKHPVIFLSLKEIKGKTWEEMLEEIKNYIKGLYNDFEYIREILNESELKTFDAIWLKKEGADYSNSIKDLTKFLYKYYKKEVILLIDEYDTPLVDAYLEKYYSEVITFFKIFLGGALKTNPYLKMGVLTGIIRVIKAGIFSDLNNLSVYSILDEKYDEDFGLTEKEVEQALKDYNIFEELNDVKFWYDGYKMGNKEVYNPWSIINFLDVKKLVAFWVKTSGNKLIKEILKTSTTDVNESLTKLFNGEDVEETITGNSDLSSLLNYEDVWELLVFSGYLTIKEKIDRRNYILKIPNQEIREFFKDEFIDLYFRESKLKKILNALKENNIEEFERIFQNMLLSSISTWDTSKEAFYHGLSFGMLSYLDGEYYVTSNFESGYGRYDIIAEPRNKNKRGFIIECKIVKDEKDLEKMSKEAIEQIKNKKYDTQLKERGIKEITLLGLAFCGKRMKVSSE